jgi:hypothetical protein
MPRADDVTALTKTQASFIILVFYPTKTQCAVRQGPVVKRLRNYKLALAFNMPYTSNVLNLLKGTLFIMLAWLRTLVAPSPPPLRRLYGVGDDRLTGVVPAKPTQANPNPQGLMVSVRRLPSPLLAIPASVETPQDGPAITTGVLSTVAGGPSFQYAAYNRDDVNTPVPLETARLAGVQAVNALTHPNCPKGTQKWGLKESPWALQPNGIPKFQRYD